MLSFDLMKNLNESETNEYKVKKQVFMEGCKVTKKELKEEVTVVSETEPHPEIGKSYAYILKHGLGGAVLPKDTKIKKYVDLSNGYTIVYLDRVLTSEELNKYDIPSEDKKIPGASEFIDYDVMKESFEAVSDEVRADNREKGLVEDINTNFANLEEVSFLEELAKKLGIKEEDIFDDEQNISNIVSNWGEPLEYNKNTGYSLNVIDGSKIEGVNPIKVYYIVIDQSEDETGDYAYEIFDDENAARNKYNSLINVTNESALTESEENLYEKISKAYINTMNLEFAFENPEDNKIYHGYFIDDDTADTIESKGIVIGPENYKEYAQVVMDGDPEEQAYIYNSWEEFFNDYIRTGIYSDLNDGVYITPEGDWDFSITPEELKKVGIDLTKYEANIKESALTEGETKVKNLKVIKEQGNIFMLENEAEGKKYIVGENYNPNAKQIEKAEIYENKDEADKDYLNRCEIIGGEDEKENVE